MNMNKEKESKYKCASDYTNRNDFKILNKQFSHTMRKMRNMISFIVSTHGYLKIWHKFYFPFSNKY